MAAPLLNPEFPKAPCVKINFKKCTLRNPRKFIDRSTVISGIFTKLWYVFYKNGFHILREINSKNGGNKWKYSLLPSWFTFLFHSFSYLQKLKSSLLTSKGSCCRERALEHRASQKSHIDMLILLKTLHLGLQNVRYISVLPLEKRSIFVNSSNVRDVYSDALSSNLFLKNLAFSGRLVTNLNKIMKIR